MTPLIRLVCTVDELALDGLVSPSVSMTNVLMNER
jgi:hypothetical protein